MVIPEEAEALIPILREPSSATRSSRKTFLLTYSAPITRKMLHFNRLNYYSVPSLPKDWQAPGWLTAELGLFAGRLYFEWNEYAAVRKILGIEEEGDDEELEERMDGLQLDGTLDDIVAETSASEAESRSSKKSSVGFTSKPILFLQEWLAVRRRGQDFVPTPMGFITQGKPLEADHPFFQRTEAERASDLSKERKMQGPTRVCDAENDDLEDLEDDFHIQAEDLSDGHSDSDIEYDSDEMYTFSDNEQKPTGPDRDRGRPARGNRGGPAGRRNRSR